MGNGVCDGGAKVGVGCGGEGWPGEGDGGRCDSVCEFGGLLRYQAHGGREDERRASRRPGAGCGTCARARIRAYRAWDEESSNVADRRDVRRGGCGAGACKV